MKIAIDIRSAGGNKAGKGQYTFHLTQSILELDKTNQYILYTKEKVAGFDHFPNCEVRQISANGLLWHPRVAKDVKREGVDIFWAPSSYITPIFIKKPTRVIITVHDLVTFLYPNNHNKKATIVERLCLKRAVKRADQVITVSENTKQDLIKFFPNAKDKTSVVYCAASSIYQPVPLEDLKTFIKDTKLPPKFFLAVSTIQPRKNYLNLIRSLAQVHKKWPNTHLLIVGKEGWQYKEVYAEIMRYNLSKYVHVLGYLSEKSIRNLYNLARALVFPSFYEGFGIPPLEAMQSGCPVIASNASSIPEVLGAAAISLDPTNTASWAAAMDKILSSETTRQSLSRAGLNQAKKFSWQKSAEKFIMITKN